MERTQEVNRIRELAGNIAANCWDGSPETLQAIHDEIQGWGTRSRYMRRGLDPDTGEYDVQECLAYDLVDFALSDEGRTSWGIDIELDEHDRALLTRFVAEALGG